MHGVDSTPNTLADWLSHLERLHPKTIALGLDRVAEVRHRLSLNPAFPLITVAGTNGKGSTCAMLEAILLAAGYRVGLYTSPHLLCYNERVRHCGEQASDEDLCAAFAAVETARGDVPLTYFEFGTLAASSYFRDTRSSAMILEVGMGGRLDAVNAFEPTVRSSPVSTSITWSISAKPSKRSAAKRRVYFAPAGRRSSVTRCLRIR